MRVPHPIGFPAATGLDWHGGLHDEVVEVECHTVATQASGVVSVLALIAPTIVAVGALGGFGTVCGPTRQNPG